MKTQNDLFGMGALCSYCKRSESTIILWIQDYDFPASKSKGEWVADKRRVDIWFEKFPQFAEQGSKRKTKVAKCPRW